jgi:hypothetical protein
VRNISLKGKKTMASNADQTGIGYPASQIDANKTQWKEYLAALQLRGLSLASQVSMLGAPISAPQSVIANPGLGVEAPNAEVSLVRNSDGSVRGRMAGTSVVFNLPPGNQS